MDVKLTLRSALFCSLVLALSLGTVSLAIADEAIVSDTEQASSISVTDATAFATDADDRGSTPAVVEAVSQSAEGSIVFIEDTGASEAPATPQTTAAPPAFVAPLQPAEQDALQVVTNRTKQDGLEVVRPANNPHPLGSTRELPKLPVTPIRQGALTNPSDVGESTARVDHAEQGQLVEREQPGDIEIAVHAEPVAASPAAPAASKSTIEPHEELLILAHKLSLAAESIEDYTQIVDACDEAIQFGAKADKRQFARQLSSWALNRRGQKYAEAGEQDAAAADFQAALDFNPRNWRAMHNRGVSDAQLGKFAEAFDDFNMVVQLNPRYAKAYANRATLYVQAKDLHSAMKDYELAIQQDSKFATAYVGLGRVCHMLGRWDDAIEYFNSAVELEPNSPDIVCSRGDLHADMGNYGAALTDYARTIELDPEFAHAYRNGAWLLATCPDEEYRDPENAVLGAQQALEYSYGDRHVALDTLAAAYASNGQFEEAIATLHQAVELAPTEAKLAYQSRLELYQANEPFRTEPIGAVTQAGYQE